MGGRRKLLIRWGSKISSGRLNNDTSCYLNAVVLVVLILAKSPFETGGFLVWCTNINTLNNSFVLTHYTDFFSSFKKAKLLLLERKCYSSSALLPYLIVSIGVAVSSTVCLNCGFHLFCKKLGIEIGKSKTLVKEIGFNLLMYSG